MDFDALYHFIFETYEGIGISILVCIVICIVLAFIMEDGSVSYVKSQDLVDNAVNDTATQVQGTLKINGTVIDAEHAHAMPKGSEGIGAYVTTFFILSDGTYVKYSDSLLN